LAVVTHCEVFTGALHALARSPSQRRLLEDALAGEAIGCFAATERDAGSDLAAATTVAHPTARGWRLVGTKHYIGNLMTATHALVVARSLAEPEGRDLSLFLVPLSDPGVVVEGYYEKLGLASCPIGDLTFDCELPDDALLGPPGTALLQVTRVLQLERISISAQLIAAARLSLGLAVAFGRRRCVFGERLLDKQVWRHRLADAQTRELATEAFLQSVVTQAGQGIAVGRQTAALKLCAAQMATAVVDECMQLLGGRGYTLNYPLEGYWRDIRAARIGGGSDELMRELVAAGIDRPNAFFDSWLDELDASDTPVAIDAERAT
jgi:alkylation response protein AidB-like acyl-CoA dehydrogenase